MVVQSLDTLVELGRPQSSHRVDASRIVRAQIQVVAACLFLGAVFAAVAVFGSRQQAAMGNPEGRTIALLVGTLFSVGSLALGVFVVMRLQGEKSTHAIVHDKGFFLHSPQGDVVMHWRQLKEIRTVPTTNAASLGGGLLGFLLARLLSGGATERLQLVLEGDRVVNLPVYLIDYDQLVASLRRQSNK